MSTTQHTIINIKSSLIMPNIIMAAAIGFFLESQERIRNSRGKRVIDVRATEVLLWFLTIIGIRVVH